MKAAIEGMKDCWIKYRFEIDYEEKNVPSIPIEQKLDPITVLVQAALLKFKEEGSRITYSNDLQVFIQQPSDYTVGICLLPIVRELKGQSHDDLGILYPAVEKATKWHNPSLKEQVVYKRLFTWTTAGLETLKKPYEDKQLTLAVKGIEDITDKIKLACVEKKDEKSNIQIVELEDKEKRVAGLWTKEDIGRINSLFSQMVLKQGKVPIKEKLLCADEISQVEFILSQKLGPLQEIWK